MGKREDICEWLQEKGVVYELAEHPPVYTIEEMEKLGLCLRGNVCKNLFLRDAKGKRHFLVLISREKQAAHAVEAFGIAGFEPRLYSRIYAHSDKWLTPAMETFARAALTEAGQA